MKAFLHQNGKPSVTQTFKLQKFAFTTQELCSLGFNLMQASTYSYT